MILPPLRQVHPTQKWEKRAGRSAGSALETSKGGKDVYTTDVDLLHTRTNYLMCSNVYWYILHSSTMLK